MTDFRWNDAATDEFLAQVGAEAASIVGHRIAEDARPMVFVLKGRPPGRKEWGYSLPAGRLRRSVEAVDGEDARGAYCDVVADVPLAGVSWLS
jgi:hypothetical protein